MKIQRAEDSSVQLLGGSSVDVFLPGLTVGPEDVQRTEDGKRLMSHAGYAEASV